MSVSSCVREASKGVNDGIGNFSRPSREGRFEHSDRKSRSGRLSEGKTKKRRGTWETPKSVFAVMPGAPRGQREEEKMWAKKGGRKRLSRPSGDELTRGE